jgi:hypothetical protein
VSRTTLGDRFRGKHDSRAIAYEPRRLLTDTDAVAELIERIKAHLLENPNLTNNTRFSGLFTSCRRAPVIAPQPQIASIPSSSSQSTSFHHQYFPPNYYWHYPRSIIMIY